MMYEPFTITAYSHATTDLVGIARERAATEMPDHAHCDYAIGWDMADAESNQFVWDADCDIQIAYIEEPAE